MSPSHHHRRTARIAGHGCAAALVAGFALFADDRIAACLFGPPRRGYLAVVGSPPLRFEADNTPATHPSEPAAISSSEADRPGPPNPPTEVKRPAPAAKAAASTPAAPKDRASTPGAKPAPQPPRLPLDIVKPVVRPEDFIPFFRLPGAPEHPAETLIVVPPQTAADNFRTPPPSSATYRQTP